MIDLTTAIIAIFAYGFACGFLGYFIGYSFGKRAHLPVARIGRRHE